MEVKTDSCITPIEFMDDFCGNNIYIKRDDLLPFSFGGNKVRIAKQFIEDMKKCSKNCMIGYGNARSNLCRALSNLCVSSNIPCHIISPADDDGLRIETANSILVKNSLVVFHECQKNNVADTVSDVLEECLQNGLSPYYIFGDIYGKGNESVPIKAYFDVYREISEQKQKLSLDFDYIFLATGTGMTQAGLIAGKQFYEGKEKIIGISVARDKEIEEKVISNYLCAFQSRMRFSFSMDDIIVSGDYLAAGYGKFNDEIENVIMERYRKNGIPLDPTYSGKAYTGMLKYIKEHNINNKRILFIHTGGTPLFFDYLYLREKKNSSSCTVIDNVSSKQLMDFLLVADKLLTTPLSERVDIEAYCKKIQSYGQVLAVIINDRIVSAAVYYCNDNISKTGYVTLLATLPEAGGKGYGRKIMHELELKASANGMERIKLEADIKNTKAIAFYSKCGYKIDFVSDKVHMVKEISK